MLQQQIDLQPAFLLHSRPFRDTSLILDFLTRDFGRVSAIAQGVRRPKAKNKGLLQPFIPLQISLSGKNELKSLRGVEALSERFVLRANFLFAGLYINEILVRLIYAQEVDSLIFIEYEQVILGLAEESELEPLLRKFEINLLHALGYGIEFNYEANSGNPIEAQAWYFFHPERGFELMINQELSDKASYYPGMELILISQQNFCSQKTRNIAKRILRSVLSYHLGDKPLKSRQLFSRK